MYSIIQSTRYREIVEYSNNVNKFDNVNEFCFSRTDSLCNIADFVEIFTVFSPFDKGNHSVQTSTSLNVWCVLAT